MGLDISSAAMRTFKFVKYVLSKFKLIIEIILGKKDVHDIFSRLNNFDKRLLAIMPNVIDPRNEELSTITEEMIEETQKTSRYYNLLTLLNTPVLSRVMSKRIKPVSDLEINIKSDLSAMMFKFDNKSITIDEPRLMWPCSCRVPDKYKTEVSCPIHFSNATLGKVISKKFGSGIVAIHYDDLEIYWFSTSTYWPPSIDAFHFVQILKQFYGSSKTVKNVLDIGAGSGFLGTYLAHINPNVKKVHFSDVFFTPVFASIYNFYRNKSKAKPKTIISNGFSQIKRGSHHDERKYDLIICNPPYLPLLGISGIAGINSVSGTYLLKEMITKFPKYAHQLLISASDIAKPEINEAIEIAQKKYPSQFRYDVIGEFLVPFRVNTAFHTSGYMEKLFSERSDNLITDPHTNSPFKVWHKIKYYMFTYS